MRVMQAGADTLIGLGHGRTISAMVDCLPRQQGQATAFVALLGGLTTSFSADPYDVIHRISDRTGVPGYFLPVPFFANSVADREVLLSQIGVSHVMKLARKTSLCIVGIGTATREGFLAQDRGHRCPGRCRAGASRSAERDPLLLPRREWRQGRDRARRPLGDAHL